MKGILLIIACVLVIIVGVWIGSSKKETVLDYIPPESIPQWWGEEESKGNQDESIRKFTITVDEEMQKDLAVRLKNTRYFNPINEDNLWARGTNPKFMKELVKYWQTEFKWEQQVEKLNAYPNFKTDIDGLTIHFVHIKANRVRPGMKVMPLILFHGWPGSFYEFYGSIPYLTDPSKTGLDFAFDLVIPSLPGYGYSSAPRRPGMSIPAIDGIFSKLMKRLNYTTYIAQGGDYGSFIARMLPLYDPNCLGIHLNLYPVETPLFGIVQVYLSSLFPSIPFLNPRDQKKILPFSVKGKELITETGYMHIQATRPNSIGHALTDSPVGLAAYVIEKFKVWSDNNGDIYSTFTKDQLLTNVMIYWTNNAIASSINYYYEIVGDWKFMHLMTSDEIHVPTGIADFHREMIGSNPPLSWAQCFKNIIQYTQFDKGGHFGAMEQPLIFSEDVISFAKLILEKQK